MKTNVSTQLLAILALLLVTVLVAVPSTANASANQSPEGKAQLSGEVVPDSTVILVKHLQQLDDLGYEAAQAARWTAMADFYAANGLLNDVDSTEPTVILVEHLQRMDDLIYETAQAARWIAMADFYARNDLLNDEGVSDSTVTLVEHWQRMDDNNAMLAVGDEVAQVVSQQ